MPPLFRQLVVPVVLTVALATSAMAQLDSVAVVTFGLDGFSLQEPDDVPVGEGMAVMLRRMGENGWSMTTLKPGDIPTEVAETMRPMRLQVSGGIFPRDVRGDRRERASAFARSHVARDLHLSRMPEVSEEVIDVFEIESQRSVLFEITARIGELEIDDTLVTALSENEALRRLEVTEDVGTGTLEARFAFDSLDEWKRWKGDPDTKQMLDALRDATRQMQTQMEVRQ